MTFGDNLKRARKAAGLTQSELAQMSGVTERSLYSYEKNSRAPKIDVVKSLAQALGISSEMLMGSSAEQPSNSLDKLLLQVRLAFESDISDREKESFFQQLAMAYFDYKNKGED